MNVVYMKGRGAVVSDPYKFVKEFSTRGKGAKLVVLPLDFCKGVEVYEFSCTFQGASSKEWAWMWLKGSPRARMAGVYVPSPSLVKESRITAQACRKSFTSQVAASNARRKKKEKCLPPGSWFLD